MYNERGRLCSRRLSQHDGAQAAHAQEIEWPQPVLAHMLHTLRRVEAQTSARRSVPICGRHGVNHSSNSSDQAGIPARCVSFVDLLCSGCFLCFARRSRTIAPITCFILDQPEQRRSYTCATINTSYACMRACPAQYRDVRRVACSSVKLVVYNYGTS